MIESQTEDWENLYMILTQRFLFRRRIRRTLSLHPSSPRALFNQLLLAANQEQGDEALTILRKLLSFPQVYTAFKMKWYFLRKKIIPSGRVDAWLVHSSLRRHARHGTIHKKSTQVFCWVSLKSESESSFSHLPLIPAFFYQEHNRNNHLLPEEIRVFVRSS